MKTKCSSFSFFHCIRFKNKLFFTVTFLIACFFGNIQYMLGNTDNVKEIISVSTNDCMMLSDDDDMEFLTIVDIKISQEMIKFKTNLSDVKN